MHQAILPKSLEYENAIFIKEHMLSSALRMKLREELFALCVVCLLSKTILKHESLKNVYLASDIS